MPEDPQYGVECSGNLFTSFGVAAKRGACIALEGYRCCNRRQRIIPMVIFPGVVVYGQEAVQLRIGCKLAIVTKQSVEVSVRLKKRINLFKDTGHLSNEECLPASPISVYEQGNPPSMDLSIPANSARSPFLPRASLCSSLTRVSRVGAESILRMLLTLIPLNS